MAYISIDSGSDTSVEECCRDPPSLRERLMLKGALEIESASVAGISRTVSKTVNTLGVEDSEGELPDVSGKLSNLSKDKHIDQKGHRAEDSNRLNEKDFVVKLETNTRESSQGSVEQTSHKYDAKRRQQATAAEKKQQREQKKAEAEAKRKTVQDARKAKRAERGEECYKSMTVIIDASIVGAGGNTAVLLGIEHLGMKITLEHGLISGIITWRRQLLDEMIQEKAALVLLTMEEFVTKIVNTAPVSLVNYVRECQSVLGHRSVTLLIRGVEKYFRDLKTGMQRAHRLRVLQDQESEEPKRKRRKNMPPVSCSRLQVEEALLDLQLETGVSVELAESGQDVADVVVAYSRAVAEAPSRRKQEAEDESFEFAVSGEDKDKKLKTSLSADGRGLGEVWVRQLVQFQRLSPDIASAIVAKYPSPKALLQAYTSASSRAEAERLLQNIPVRRGAGVLATIRHVNAEHSRQVHTFMTSRDGEAELEEEN